jgi:hypothetical protein
MDFLKTSLLINNPKFHELVTIIENYNFNNRKRILENKKIEC